MSDANTTYDIAAAMTNKLVSFVLDHSDSDPPLTIEYEKSMYPPLTIEYEKSMYPPIWYDRKSSRGMSLGYNADEVFGK